MWVLLAKAIEESISRAVDGIHIQIWFSRDHNLGGRICWVQGSKFVLISCLNFVQQGQH